MIDKIITLVLTLLLLFITNSLAQDASTRDGRSVLKPLSEVLLKRISPDLRDKARELGLKAYEEYQQHLLKSSDDDLRAAVVDLLANKPEAADFLINLLEKDPSAKVRTSIVQKLEFRHWRAHPRTRQLLVERITSDPDVSVIMMALETIRSLEMQGMRRLLEERIEAARQRDDRELIRRLAQEQERWISLERGVMLPSFLRIVPPLFSLKSAGRPIRVIAFGDFGVAKQAQEQVAAAIRAYHKKMPFDFGLTVGDNFYGAGMESTSDPRWESRWEHLYPLGIKFYATLGNHDWGHPDSPTAEILYSEKSRSWRMPAPYYTFMAGSVQFFALDTTEISEAQLLWLKEELEKSRARWKVVYGHHPIYVSSFNGPQYTEAMQAKVMPVLKGRADLYMSGHHHSLQHLRPEGGVHFVVSGGGGRRTYAVNESEPRALFAKSVNGFTVLQASERELIFRHVGINGKDLYSHALRR